MSQLQLCETVCPEVIRLRAEVDVIKEWKEEVTGQLRDINGIMMRIQAVAITTLLGVVLSLAYLIISHVMGK